MTISWLKTFGTAVLASALALSGGLAFGESGGLGGSQEPAKPVQDAVARQAIPVPPAEPSARAVSRFADVLKRHPARRVPKEGERLQLYMMDLVEGGTTLLADEPDPGLDWCATPKWSHDGTRIVFAARSRARFQECLASRRSRSATDSRLARISGRAIPRPSPRMTNGLCSCSDPDPSRGPRPASGSCRPTARNDDGSSEYRGAPFWSPDGREILINDYSNGPTTTLVINLETKEGDILQVAGHQIFSWPSWVGPGTLVSALATGGEGDSIACSTCASRPRRRSSRCFGRGATTSTSRRAGRSTSPRRVVVSSSGWSREADALLVPARRIRASEATGAPGV